MLNIGGVLKSDLTKFANNVAKELATKARDMLDVEYKRTVIDFYNDYDPIYYKRHDSPGLLRTHTKYYQNSHNSIYRGGITISADKMYTDYHDSNSSVLSSFLGGYHGRPSLGIWTSPTPYDHIIKYRDVLAANMGAYKGEAIEKAKHDSYAILFK